MPYMIIAWANFGMAALVVLLSIPMWLGRVPRNGLYGARFPESLESDEKWYPVNRFTAQRMMLWSIPVALSGLLALSGSPILLVVAVLTPLPAYVIACWQSWQFARSL